MHVHRSGEGLIRIVPFPSNNLSVTLYWRHRVKPAYPVVWEG
jgi:hypothetical protein